MIILFKVVLFLGMVAGLRGLDSAGSDSDNSALVELR
jgi:hypothetical protein